MRLLQGTVGIPTAEGCGRWRDERTELRLWHGSSAHWNPLDLRNRMCGPTLVQPCLTWNLKLFHRHPWKKYWSCPSIRSPLGSKIGRPALRDLRNVLHVQLQLKPLGCSCRLQHTATQLLRALWIVLQGNIHLYHDVPCSLVFYLIVRCSLSCIRSL